METGTFYKYDGSFQGFLTTVAEALGNDAPVAGISRDRADQPPLFAVVKGVLTNRPRAEQLWKKLERRSPALSRLVYFSYLSETTDIELIIYNYLNALFNSTSADGSRIADWRQRLESIARRVDSEKRELERELPFASSADGIPCACASPAANVLPLLTRYYKSRFAGQAWMIYDTRRNYGVFWHGGELELIGIRPQASTSRAMMGDQAFFETNSLRSLLLPKVLENSLSAPSGTGHRIRSAV